jgi:Ca-activated chloride channel family protein
MHRVLDRWFANPWAVWLLTALPVLAGFAALAWYRRRRAVALLGPTPSLQLVAVKGRGRRGLRGLCFSAGLLFLVLGVAGPQWGQEPGQEGELAGGRDVVVVLDLSRSMLAEQPSRQERALRMLRDLAYSFRARGGNRVALVVFAAHAKLVFPLTTDYDHFQAALDQQDADNLPPGLRPQKDEAVGSGTRIGEALRLAVATHDPRFPGAQDILLLSDGDDPAGDGEWAEGAAAARDKHVPVYTVGVGDPETASPIPTASGPLRHDGQVVKTRLEERPLREIARRTRGVYLPAHTDPLPVGKLFREVAEPRGARPAGEPVEPALPLYRQYYAWFFGTALGLLVIPVVTGRPRFGRRFGRGEAERLGPP